MLKRNRVLVAFLVVAILCASIGFAAVSDILTAEGKLNLTVVTGSELASEFDKDVYFSAASNGGVTGVTAEVNGTDVDKVDINIDNTVFESVGQEVTVTATIQNDGEYAVTLAAPIKVETGIEKYATISEATLDSTNLDAKESTTLTIKVKLTAIPADEVTNAAFSVSVVATPAQ